MSEPGKCPECGCEIPANMPSGLCPQCLLKAGLPSQAQSKVGPDTEASPKTGPGNFVAPTPEQLAAIIPQIEILELLAKGGMGAVYKGRQRTLDRLVAVKILPPDIGHDVAFADRFAREARALAKLSHPNIVGVHDFGQANGLFYFVMEYVDGANLRHLLRERKFTPKDALAIVPQMCDALQFAHDEGVVHRDIKPENILIDKKGRVKIADFGLAKLLGQDAPIDNLTATHQVMGTIKYMAPEQMEGAKDIDHRADIYSLGVVFYELLTGELPLGRFAAPSKKVQIDVRLDEIVLRALEKEPSHRYQHASEVKTEVESVIGSPRQSTARPTSEAAANADVRPNAAKDDNPFLRWLHRLTADEGGYARWVGAPLLGFLGFCLFVATMAFFLADHHDRMEKVLMGFFCLSPVLVSLFLAFLSALWLVRRQIGVPEPPPTGPWTPEQVAENLRQCAGMMKATGIVTFIGWIVLTPFVNGISMPVLWAMFAGAIISVGAVALARQRDPGHAAPILAMVPFSPAVVLGLPVGLRVLRILARPEVQAYLEEKARERLAAKKPA